MDIYDLMKLTFIVSLGTSIGFFLAIGGILILIKLIGLEYVQSDEEDWQR